MTMNEWQSPRPDKNKVLKTIRSIGLTCSLHEMYYEMQRSKDGLYDLGAIHEVAHSLTADGVLMWHEKDNTFSESSDGDQLLLF